ncbi:hypothetical protein ABBQ32_013436 [Trebouxia sp. C0010 RCD-2024]
MHRAQMALVPDVMYLLPRTGNAADELRTPEKFDVCWSDKLNTTHTQQRPAHVPVLALLADIALDVLSQQRSLQSSRAIQFGQHRLHDLPEQRHTKLCLRPDTQTLLSRAVLPAAASLTSPHSSVHSSCACSEASKPGRLPR